jgi:MFS family permease
MKKGFSTIMSAQFFSSLADNALFVAAVELIRESGSAQWQGAALVPMFALFYVLLAPFVGAFADAVPKGQVMFYSNLIKIVGCLTMLFGAHPLLAYGIVGFGAAAYSPAKYGILTELRCRAGQGQRLDRGMTIASPALLGGQPVGPVTQPQSSRLRRRWSTLASTRRPKRRSGAGWRYLLAAIINLTFHAPMRRCSPFRGASPQ